MQKAIFILFSPLLLTAIYDLLFYAASASRYKELDGFFSEYIIIQSFIFVLLWLVLSFLSFNKSIKQYVTTVPSNRVTVLAYLSILFLCILLFSYLFYQVFGNFDVLALFSNFGYFYAQSRVGTSWVIFLIMICVFFITYDVFKAGISKFKVVIFSLCMLLLLLSGGRTLGIILIAMMFYIRLVVHGERISSGAVIAALAFFVVIFYVNSVYRSGAENISDYLESRAASMDFDNSKVLADTLTYNQQNETGLFVSLQDFAYLLIPRSFYPEKPVSTAETRLVYSEMLADGRTTNITFGIYGNLAINVSSFSMVLAPLLIIMLGFTYHIFFQKWVTLKTSFFFTMVFFLFYPLVLRGGFVNARIFLILLLFAIAVFIWHTTLLLAKKKKKVIVIRRK